MRRTARGVAMSILLGLAGAGPGAAMGVERGAAMEAARETFKLGLEGSKQENEKAAKQFALLTQEDPKDPLALAYWGSTFTIRARDAFWPWTRLELGEEGLDRIDRALRLLETDRDGSVPEAVRAETTLVAASTFLQVPDRYFHRAEQGRRLVREALAAPGFPHWPPPLRAAFHEQAARAARQEESRDEEVAQLRALLALAGEGPRAERARGRLGELGESP